MLNTNLATNMISLNNNRYNKASKDYFLKNRRILSSNICTKSYKQSAIIAQSNVPQENEGLNNPKMN